VPRRRGRILQFFKTPKGQLAIVLAILVAIAAPHYGIGAVAPGLLSAVAAASLVDALILRIRKKVWEFPSGALLTAMIIAMVLRVEEPWYITAAISLIAVVSKYILRTRSANVFNPAALGVVATFYLFHTGQNWWGALPDVTLIAQPVLIIAGIYITDRVNKMPLVLAFLGTYFLLFTITAFAGNPRWVSEIYRSPDIQAVLFFAFIILTDPPTSPPRYSDQLICGVIVAVASYAVFELIGAVYYLLAGVLVGNVWEAWRRTRSKTKRSRGQRHFGAAVSAFGSIFGVDSP